MNKISIYLLSALILLAYGFLAGKIIFMGLGATFGLMALAVFLRQKK